MITELLDQIQRLDQQATKGPWLSHYGGNPHDQWLSVEPKTGSRTICTVTDDHHPNAEFIALSRTVLPQLAKALQAAIEGCEETIRSVDKNLLPNERDHAFRDHAEMILDQITDAMEGDDEEH